MAQKLNEYVERARMALKEKRTRMALIVALVAVVIVALIVALRATSPAPSAPDAPSNLAATALSYKQIDLTWQDNSGDETGFKIERKIGATGTYGQIGTVKSGVDDYSDAGLTEDTTYYYRVRAYNANGDSPYSDEVSAVTPLLTIPNAPSNLVATSVSYSKIELTWNDTSLYEDGFKIERKMGDAGSYVQVPTDPPLGTDANTYVDTDLIENTAYFYRVRAFNDAGHSDFSNVADARTLAPAYHAVGIPAEVGNYSVSVYTMEKTDHYKNFNMYDKSTYNQTLPGTLFVLVSVGITNRGDDTVNLELSDFALRDSATRGSYEIFDYQKGDVGTPLPKDMELRGGRSISGVVLYLVPEAAPTSGMEFAHVTADEMHIWRTIAS